VDLSRVLGLLLGGKYLSVNDVGFGVEVGGGGGISDADTDAETVPEAAGGRERGCGFGGDASVA
jgi:hypothetical protein